MASSPFCAAQPLPSEGHVSTTFLPPTRFKEDMQWPRRRDLLSAKIAMVASETGVQWASGRRRRRRPKREWQQTGEDEAVEDSITYAVGKLAESPKNLGVSLSRQDARGRRRVQQRAVHELERRGHRIDHRRFHALVRLRHVSSRPLVAVRRRALSRRFTKTAQPAVGESLRQRRPHCPRLDDDDVDVPREHLRTQHVREGLECVLGSGVRGGAWQRNDAVHTRHIDDAPARALECRQQRVCELHRRVKVQGHRTLVSVRWQPINVARQAEACVVHKGEEASVPGGSKRSLHYALHALRGG
mmetsp:Transcript_35384/g.68042  ORF Transcript_35384/g.68042 Transcript_35384/m.68042 type:complete len:301 (+) Transcript_35384:1116-2018(+)